MIAFGEYAPDRKGVSAPLLLQALNVVPKADGYAPFPGFAAFGGALGSRVRGGQSFRDQDGTVHVFAGDETSLNELQSDQTWLDKSRVSGGPYACAETSHWTFTQFGDLAIATNFDDAVQAVDMSAGGAFANLAGSPPRAKYICTFVDFVFLGYTDTSPNEIAWCGINDATGWTAGVNQSDRQLYPDGGFVQGFAPNDGFMLVFQQKKVRLVQYVGPPAIMDLSVTVEQEEGLLEPRSLCQSGRKTFYLSDSGFKLIDGVNAAAPIGQGKVDEFFLGVGGVGGDCDRNYLYRMSAATDASRSLAMWLYPSTGSASGAPNRLLLYYWPKGRWTLVETEAELIFNALALGYTLEDLDDFVDSIDDFEIPLDDPLLMGGFQRLGVFNRSSAFGAFAGDALQATIETGDFELLGKRGQRAYVSAIRPVTDAADATAAIACRERLADAAVYGPDASLELDGSAGADASGRYHRARLTIPAGASWTYAQGLDFEAQPDGEV